MDTCNRPSVADPASLFYFDVVTRLRAAALPFLVGGAFAYSRYSGIDRPTKDLDLFVMPSDVPRAFALFEASGYRTELPFPHWLGKVRYGEHFMDIIFGSGNGLAEVDALWFDHAVEHTVLGERLLLCPPEEMIWSKAFIQERERHDGADVLHLFRELGHSLDWHRLLTRFGEHWPVLFAHIVLFRYVYPDKRDEIPEWVVEELSRRFTEEHEEPRHICRGTLLSREQYLHDLHRLRYEDARLRPAGRMTRAEIEIWTAAIGAK